MIHAFYNQIILNRGLPFEIKISAARTADVSEIGEAELNAELEKGYADMAAGIVTVIRVMYVDSQLKEHTVM